MVTKNIFAIPLSFAFFISAAGQDKNAGIRGAKYPFHSFDTLELMAYQSLVHALSARDTTLDTKEVKNASVLHSSDVTQEEPPLQSFVIGGVAMETRFSNNFRPTVYNKEALHGSPFFLSSFVPGMVVNEQNVIIDKTDYLYNFDKMSGNLLLQIGKEKPIAVYKSQVRFFCLKLASESYIFERVSFIKPDEFVQVLYRGPKYSFYKLYKNRFVSADQRNNGYTTEGNNYDEYQDIVTYYLFDQVKGEALIFYMTKRSIHKTFSSQSAVVELFFKEHKTDVVDESLTIHLLEKLNQ